MKNTLAIFAGIILLLAPIDMLAALALPPEGSYNLFGIPFGGLIDASTQFVWVISIITILNIIEGHNIRRIVNNREYYLQTSVFPSFRNYYDQYYSRDRNNARHILDNCILKIQNSSSDIYAVKDCVLLFFYCVFAIFAIKLEI